MSKSTKMVDPNKIVHRTMLKSATLLQKCTLGNESLLWT